MPEDYKLNNYIKSIEKSETLLINELSRELESQNKEIIKFGFGESPFLPPSHVIQALQQNAYRKEYTPVAGIKELLNTAASFHSRLYDLSISEENIITGPGSKILIFTFLSAFKEANVFIPVPAWVSYEPQAKLLGHNVIKINTLFKSRWHITGDILEKSLQTVNNSSPNILILNYPGNPDGLTYSEKDLKDLSAVLKKYNVLVISDEIYGLLHHNGNHVSLAKFYPQGTIITTGLSKWCGAGGWRLGLLILPDLLVSCLKNTLIGIASETYSCASVPVQLAAKEAYSDYSRVEKYISYQRKILSVLGNYVASTLSATGIKLHRPDGAFYLYPDFSDFKDKLTSLRINNSAQLCKRLLQDISVALLPGNAFGEKEILTARLAYVDFNGEEVLNAAYELKNKDQINIDFLNIYCKKVISGANKIKDWFLAL